jgi:hypothetical protein
MEEKYSNFGDDLQLTGFETLLALIPTYTEKAEEVKESLSKLIKDKGTLSSEDDVKNLGAEIQDFIDKNVKNAPVSLGLTEVKDYFSNGQINDLISDGLLPIRSAGSFFRRNDFHVLKDRLGQKHPVPFQKMEDNLKAVCIITDERGFSNFPTLDTMQLNKGSVGISGKSGGRLTVHNSFVYGWQQALKVSYGTCFFVDHIRSSCAVMMAEHSWQAMMTQHRLGIRTEFFAVREFCMGLQSGRATYDVYKIDITNPLSANVELDQIVLPVSAVGTSKAPTTKIQLPVSNVRICAGMDTYCIGHGMNLPAKLSLHGIVFSPNCNQPSRVPGEFKAKLETFPGNSGSPIFDAATHALIGMVSGGDYLNVPLYANSGTFMPHAQLGGTMGATCKVIR